MPARKAASGRSGTPAAKKARPVRVAVRNRAVEESAAERMAKEARDELTADISGAGFEGGQASLPDTPAARLRHARDHYPEHLELASLHELRRLQSLGLRLDECARQPDVPYAVAKKLAGRLRERMALEAKTMDPYPLVSWMLEELKASTTWSVSIREDSTQKTSDRNRANADAKAGVESIGKVMAHLGLFDGGRLMPRSGEEEQLDSGAVLARRMRETYDRARYSAFGDGTVDVHYSLGDLDGRGEGEGD